MAYIYLSAYAAMSVALVAINVLNFYSDIISGIVTAMLSFFSILAILSAKSKKAAILNCVLQTTHLVFITAYVIAMRRWTSLSGSFLITVNIAVCQVIYHMIVRSSKLQTGLNDEAVYDSLTKAYNRRYLLDKISSLDHFYLLFCDLDNFKSLNDSLGHSAGDSLLQQLASLWMHIKARASFELCRNGGDEFVFIVYTDDRYEAEALAEQVIEKTKEQKSAYFSYITVSVGIAGFPYDTTNRSKILTYADNAMYEAKNSGKNQLKIFDSKMKADLKAIAKFRSSILACISTHSFDIMYQPQVDIKTKKIMGAESLLRIRDPDNNELYLNSQKLIDIAESDGLIVDLDRLIIDKVLSEVSSLLGQKPDFIVSINISGKHIVSDSFSEDMYDDLKKHDIDPKSIELEITEESYVKSIKIASDNARRLKRYGLKIALDDFGTGYSSLRYLNDIEFNVLKIDKSFVDDIGKNASIVSLIISMAKELGCKTVAEGVETKEQLIALQNLGCDFIQGYYFYKPMSIESLKQLLI